VLTVPLNIDPKWLGVIHVITPFTSNVNVKVKLQVGVCINGLLDLYADTLNEYLLTPADDNVGVPVIHPVKVSPVSPNGNAVYA
jgi:hypothetical protein